MGWLELATRLHTHTGTVGWGVEWTVADFQAFVEADKISFSCLSQSPISQNWGWLAGQFIVAPLSSSSVYVEY